MSAKLNLRVKVWRVTHFDVLPGKVGDLWSKAARGVHWADRSLVPLDDVEFCAHPVIILRKEEKAARWMEWLVKHSSISSHIVIHLQSHAMQRELNDRCINGRGPSTNMTRISMVLRFVSFKCIQLIKYFRTSVQPVSLSQFLNNFDNNNIWMTH